MTSVDQISMFAAVAVAINSRLRRSERVVVTPAVITSACWFDNWLASSAAGWRVIALPGLGASRRVVDQPSLRRPLPVAAASQTVTDNSVRHNAARRNHAVVGCTDDTNDHSCTRAAITIRVGTSYTRCSLCHTMRRNVWWRLTSYTGWRKKWHHFFVCLSQQILTDFQNIVDYNNDESPFKSTVCEVSGHIGVFCLFVFLFLPLLVCFVIVLFSAYPCMSVCLLPMWWIKIHIYYIHKLFLCWPLVYTCMCTHVAQWNSHLEFELGDQGSIPRSRHYSIG